jgi:hypothetical protein
MTSLNIPEDAGIAGKYLAINATETEPRKNEN